MKRRRAIFINSREGERERKSALWSLERKIFISFRSRPFYSSARPWDIRGGGRGLACARGVSVSRSFLERFSLGRGWAGAKSWSNYFYERRNGGIVQTERRMILKHFEILDDEVVMWNSHALKRSRSEQDTHRFTHTHTKTTRGRAAPGVAYAHREFLSNR